MRRAKQSEFNVSDKRVIRLLWREALRADRRSNGNVYECYGVAMATRVLRSLITVCGDRTVDGGLCIDGAIDRHQRSFSERLIDYKERLSCERDRAMLTEKTLLGIIREIEAGVINVVPTGNDVAWGYSGIYAFVTKGRTDDCNLWSDGYEFAFFSDCGGWDYCEWVKGPDGSILFDYMDDAGAMPDLANYCPDTVAAWTAWGIDAAWGEWTCNEGPRVTSGHSSIIEGP